MSNTAEVNKTNSYASKKSGKVYNYSSKKAQTKEDAKKERKKFAYIPVLKQEDTDMSFHEYAADGTLSYRNVLRYRLIKTLDELREFAKTCKDKIIAVDTETTGLTYYKDYIVGFSISTDALSGIYVPIRHEIKQTIKIEKQATDEDGNLLFLKSKKPKMIKETVYKFFPQPANLPEKEALDILYKIMLDAKINLLHNSRFDLVMLKGEGYDVMKLKTFDTQILPYIYDAENKKGAGLKPISQRLGRYVPDFKDALGKEENFKYTDPNESYLYACFDTANTYNVYNKLYKLTVDLLKKNRNKVISINNEPYNVLKKDNALIRAFVDYYGESKLKVNKEVAKDYKKLIEEGLRDTSVEIYEYFNTGTFNLSPTSKEFKLNMSNKQIDTGHRTDTGNISFGKEGIKEMNKNLNNLRSIYERPNSYTFINGKLNKRESREGFILSTILGKYGKPYLKQKTGLNIDELRDLKGTKIETKEELMLVIKNMYKNEKGKLEVLKKIQKVSSLNKAMNSYIEKLTEVGECVINYKLQDTSSGRLSSGNGSKTDKKRKNFFYIDLNAQNLTKPSSAFFLAKENGDESKGILGYDFELVTNEFYREHAADTDNYFFVEGTNPTANIRKCIEPYQDNRLVLSLDYTMQELIVMSDLSKDSAMLDAFLHGKDLHEETALAIWGKDKYDKEKRKKAKTCNFLMAYGGTAFTLASRLEISYEEALEITQGHAEAYFELYAWKNKVVEEMYQNGGTTFTCFGRPRQFSTRIRQADGLGDEKESLRMLKAVERRVPNHQIQGACGDIMRNVLIELHKKYFKNRDPHIDFMSTVHDEINFSVDREHVLKYVKELEEIMTFKELKPVPVEISIDIGNDLGSCFPFVWKDETKTKLVPKRA